MIAPEELARRLRPQFARTLAEHPGIYLANHSLGRPPDRAAADVAAALAAWYQDQGEAWDAWLATREKFRALTARLVGVPDGKAIVPKTSAGQGLRAVLNAHDAKLRVVASDEEFDSIDFILRVYRERGRIELRMEPWRRLRPEGADLVVLSSVLFRTGEIVEGLPELVRRAHAAGAKVLLDVYHHAGVLPVDLAALDVDFAIGGSYKYLRGGPGACWLYVHPRHQGLVTLDTGWFAKEDVFGYARPDPPRFAAGGDAWLESTPPVLAPAQALAGLEFTLETGVARLRAFHLEQKRRFGEILKGEGVAAEGAGADHGAFLSVRHDDAVRLSAELMRRGVKTDARGDRLRLCADFLNTEEELATAARKLAELLR